jgi:hypothetical protein
LTPPIFKNPGREEAYLAGLKDKVPKNHGRTFISLAMQDAIAKPYVIGHSPSPTAIYRFCKANGLKRNPEKMAASAQF